VKNNVLVNSEQLSLLATDDFSWEHAVLYDSTISYDLHIGIMKVANKRENHVKNHLCQGNSQNQLQNGEGIVNYTLTEISTFIGFTTY